MRRIALLLLALPALCACERGVHWQQETRLHDGRTLTVERVSQRPMLDFLSGDGGTSAHEIGFTHPDGSPPIHWRLPKGTAPHMLDFDGPNTYLVLATDSPAAYNAWQCPNPPWIVYRHFFGVWMRIGLDELPARFVTPNLLPAEQAADHRATAADMQAHLQTLPREARSISRAKVNPLAVGCQAYLLHRLGREAEAATGAAG